MTQNGGNGQAQDIDKLLYELIVLALTTYGISTELLSPVYNLWFDNGDILSITRFRGGRAGLRKGGIQNR